MKKMVLMFSLIAGAAVYAAQAAPAAEATAPAAKAAPAPAAAKVSVAVKPAAPAPAPAAVPVPAAPAPKKEPGIALCLSRGLCNIGTGWLELPRCMIYDNGFIPVFGLLVGIPEGAVLTIGRTFCGVYDLLSFGTSGSTCHGEIFPDTVFQSKWVYRK